MNCHTKLHLLIAMIINNFVVVVCSVNKPIFLFFLALISSIAVLSAAHCFDPPNTGNTKIAIGRIDLNNGNQGCMFTVIANYNTV